MVRNWDAVGAAVGLARQRLRLLFQEGERARDELLVEGPGNVDLLLNEFFGKIVLRSCENIVLLSE